MGSSQEFIRSLDTLAQTDMEQIRDHFTNCGYVSTLAVVIGCALELPEVVQEYWSTLHRFENKVKKIGTLGLLLVILGVTGELIFARFANRYDGLLQAFGSFLLIEEQSRTAQAELEAAEATKATLSLGEDTQRLKTDAATQKRIAASALREAGMANEKAASDSLAEEKIRNDNLRLQAQLTQTQIALLAVEEKYATRTLSKPKHDILVELLQKHPQKPPRSVLVRSYIGASDGVSYALEIIAAINDANSGWKASYEAQSTNGGNLIGVKLLVHATDGPKWGIDLQEALRSAGIGGEGVLDSAIAPDSFVLFVARKN